MQTRRTLVWLILFLVTVPTVVATADAVERTQREDMFVEIPPLREGERYVYDLYFSSEARKVDSTATDFLTVEVGNVMEYRLLDGNVVDVLPVTTTTGTAPWQALDAESEHEVVVQYLRVSDGQVVATETRKEALDHQTDEDGEISRVERETVSLYQHDRLNGGHDLPGAGQRYTNVNMVVHAILVISGFSDGHRVEEVGSFNGKKVYNLDAGDGSSRSNGIVGCSLDHPRVRYSDDIGSRLGLEGDFYGEKVDAAWYSPKMSFPLVTSCDATFTDGSGQHVETLQLDLVLTQHREGGRAVVFGHEALPLPSAEPLPVVASRLPGLPMQGDIDLLFPLEEAVQVLLSAPELDAFRDEGSVPFMVTSFQHDPSTPTERPRGPDPTGNIPDPLGAIPPEAQGDEPRTDAVWEFGLRNQTGSSIEVVVDRAYDAAGDVVDQDVEYKKQFGGSAVLDDFPKELPTFAELLRQQARLTGTDPDVWATDPTSVFRSHSSLSIMTSGTHVERTLHLRSSFRGATYDESMGRWTSTDDAYDLRTGAPTSRVSSVTRAEDVESVPPGHAPPLQTAASVVPESGMRAAATASGLAVALAFVAAYFSEGISRAVIAPFYAKIRKDKVLDHQTRDQIVEYDTANPGATLGAVRRQIESGYGTAVHHLNTLERNGLLASRKVGRERCYFPTGTLSPAEMEAVAASGTDAAARLLRLVAKEPGLTQQELAARLGVHPSSIRYQAKRLLGHGRLRAERAGREVHYFAATAPPVTPNAYK